MADQHDFDRIEFEAVVHHATEAIAQLAETARRWRLEEANTFETITKGE